MRVLLVATSPAVAGQVRAALGSPGTDIDHVATPARALAVLDGGEVYDVVVADADTTPTGGFALSREVKSRELMGRAMPRVALLISRHEDLWLASWSRADVCLRKPTDPFDLASVVEALAAGRPVPDVPGAAAPSAAVAGDVFGLDEPMTGADTVANAGP